MKTICGIYKITNPKGKIYIGQSINIEKRWYSYKSPDLRCMGIKVYNSIKKYGIENHKMEILETCEPSKLKELEIHYKILFNSVNTGLNCKIDDDRYGPHTEKTKKLISERCKEAAKRRIYTDEWRLKMKLKKTNHPCYKNLERNKKIGDAHRGKVVSEETKRKIYTNDVWIRKNKELHKSQQKSIIQLDKNNNIIKVWESITSARKTLNIKTIDGVLNRSRKTAGGFIWKYNK